MIGGYPSAYPNVNLSERSLGGPVPCRLANVQLELDKLLTVRLRDAGDVRKLFEALKVRLGRVASSVVGGDHVAVVGCGEGMWPW